MFIRKNTLKKELDALNIKIQYLASLITDLHCEIKIISENICYLSKSKEEIKEVVCHEQDEVPRKRRRKKRD